MADTDYTDDLMEGCAVLTIEEYLKECKMGMIIDYDGFGNPVKEGKCSRVNVYPSRKGKDIPKDATHVIWYNR